ncbi:MAG TPA: SynChlorMet cassette protein ScmD [Desulfomonilaceae bacterium]|nr:SynChlorMet cassette protein ScmD [Desulfomonilaceae bacterium]
MRYSCLCWVNDVSDHNKPIANSELVLREEFDDWAILFDPDSGEAFGLNPVAVFIWKLLDGTRSVAAITEELAKHCDDVPPEAMQHIGEFIGDLEKRGYVGYELRP